MKKFVLPVMQNSKRVKGGVMILGVLVLGIVVARKAFAPIPVQVKEDERILRKVGKSSLINIFYHSDHSLNNINLIKCIKLINCYMSV